MTNAATNTAQQVNAVLQTSENIEQEVMKGKYLSFSICGESYGLEIFYVTEIISMQAITPVPDLEHYLKGVINLRGTIVPVMDVRLRFGRESQEYDDRTCIIVVSLDGILAGMVVDYMQEVVDIAEEDILPTPVYQKDTDEGNRQFVRGIGRRGEHVSLLLDVHQLLGDAVKDAPPANASVAE